MDVEKGPASEEQEETKQEAESEEKEEKDEADEKGAGMNAGARHGGKENDEEKNVEGKDREEEMEKKKRKEKETVVKKAVKKAVGKDEADGEWWRIGIETGARGEEEKESQELEDDGHGEEPATPTATATAATPAAAAGTAEPRCLKRKASTLGSAELESAPASIDSLGGVVNEAGVLIAPPKCALTLFSGYQAIRDAAASARGRPYRADTKSHADVDGETLANTVANATADRGGVDDGDGGRDCEGSGGSLPTGRLSREPPRVVQGKRTGVSTATASELGRAWRSLPRASRAAYLKASKMDSARYARELRESAALPTNVARRVQKREREEALRALQEAEDDDESDEDGEEGGQAEAEAEETPPQKRTRATTPDTVSLKLALKPALRSALSLKSLESVPGPASVPKGGSPDSGEATGLTVTRKRKRAVVFSTLPVD